MAHHGGRPQGYPWSLLEAAVRSPIVPRQAAGVELLPVHLHDFLEDREECDGLLHLGDVGERAALPHPQSQAELHVDVLQVRRFVGADGVDPVHFPVAKHHVAHRVLQVGSHCGSDLHNGDGDRSRRWEVHPLRMERAEVPPKPGALASLPQCSLRGERAHTGGAVRGGARGAQAVQSRSAIADRSPGCANLHSSPDVLHQALLQRSTPSPLRTRQGLPREEHALEPAEVPTDQTSPRTADTARQARCQVTLCSAGPRGSRPAETVNDGGGGGSEPSRSRSRRGAEQVGDEEGRRSAMIGTML